MAERDYELTIRIPAEAKTTEDWRDDHRLDLLAELACALFPGDVDASGRVAPDEPVGKYWLGGSRG